MAETVEIIEFHVVYEIDGEDDIEIIESQLRATRPIVLDRCE